jgi:hypothetical protein
MNKQQGIHEKINEALESLDGIQRAEPAPFLFTRVKARLEREQHNIWETAGSFMTRPVIAFAGLFFIFCVNAYILYQKDSISIDQPTATSQNSTLLVEEYVLTAANSNYDYENIEP